MPLNKRALSEKLGVSEATLTSWQKSGMPVLKHGSRGKSGVYDLAAVARWMRSSGYGCLAKNPRHWVNLDAIERELGAIQPTAAATVAADRHPSLIALLEMFLLARSALDAGSFAELKPGLQAAMRNVPHALRNLVEVEGAVMDALIQPALDFFAKVDAEYPDPPGVNPKKEMSDEEADEMGRFWYDIAAGYQYIALPFSGDRSK